MTLPIETVRKIARTDDEVWSLRAMLDAMVNRGETRITYFKLNCFTSQALLNRAEKAGAISIALDEKHHVKAITATDLGKTILAALPE